MKAKLTHSDFQRAARELGCEVAAVKAVCEVEAPKGGFLPDGQVTILFERHKFYQFTKGAFVKSHPVLCNPKAGGYGSGGQLQHTKLAAATKLNRTAALLSCSWGKFQIMGYNYRLAGFKSLQAFINAMHESEGRQLDAFIQFVKNSGLADELKRKDWTGFALGYNGRKYYINQYDKKMAAAYKKFSA